MVSTEFGFQHLAVGVSRKQFGAKGDRLRYFVVGKTHRAMIADVSLSEGASFSRDDDCVDALSEDRIVVSHDCAFEHPVEAGQYIFDLGAEDSQAAF
jgi:hypothetical protein